MPCASPHIVPKNDYHPRPNRRVIASKHRLYRASWAPHGGSLRVVGNVRLVRVLVALVRRVGLPRRRRLRARIEALKALDILLGTSPRRLDRGGCPARGTEVVRCLITTECVRHVPCACICMPISPICNDGPPPAQPRFLSDAHDILSAMPQPPLPGSWQPAPAPDLLALLPLPLAPVVPHASWRAQRTPPPQRRAP